MRSEGFELGWRGWSGLPRFAGGLVIVPIVVGYVALGAGVVLARSLRTAARGTWARVPSVRPLRNGTGPRP